jgi:drug/metabolite transporter (DMT)-like permease
MGMQRTTDGWGSGLLGVIIFSGSLPATRIGVGGFSPLFLTSARAVIAALLGTALLLLLRQKRPARGDVVSLAIVAFGVVIGFPLLTGLPFSISIPSFSLAYCPYRPQSLAYCVAGSDQSSPSGFSPLSAL